MTSVTGFAEFADDLDDFGDGLEDCAGDGIEDVADATADETAEEVADDAQRFVPVDTGLLRSRIFVWPYPEQAGVRHIIAATDYAKYVEYGTAEHWIQPTEETSYDEPVLHPGATASPYMTPALLLNDRTLHREFEREMERLFKRNLR